MPEQDVFENEVEVKADLPQTAEVRQYVSSVSVGNVTTLPAGSQATVENVGTEEHAIFDFGLPKGDAGSMWGELSGNIGDQADLSEILTNQEAAINVKAPLASPALTGTPTAPTAVDGTSSSQIATTAFVSNAVTNLNNTLQTYVQNYVNQAVANVLKTMNWAGKVDVNLARNQSYTVPSNGYFIFGAITTPASITIDNKTILGGGSVVMIVTGTVISVKAGSVFRVGDSSTASLQGAFVPQV